MTDVIHLGADEPTPTSPGRVVGECAGCSELRKRIAKIEARFPEDIDARELEGQVDQHESRLGTIEAALVEFRDLNKGVKQVLSLNHVFAMTLEKANVVMMRATLLLDANDEREAKAALHG